MQLRSYFTTFRKVKVQYKKLVVRKKSHIFERQQVNFGYLRSIQPAINS